MDYSRRTFLKGAAAAGTIAAAGLALSSCSTTASGEASDANDISWDHEADIVIVGFGGAGSSCAHHATMADPSTTIIILEKQPEGNHYPNTKICGGALMFAKDAKRATNYMQICAGSHIPADITAAWAEEAAKILQYLKDIGFSDEPFFRPSIGEHASFEDADSVGVLQMTAETGASILWSYMEESCKKDNISIMYETPGYRLVTRDIGDHKNEILGVEALRGNEPVFIKANKGVLLACGGFEWNDELKGFLPADNIYFYCNPACTGDGVVMAQEVGAQLWHMQKMLGRGIGVYDDFSQSFILRISPAPYIMVDKYAKRFINEDLQAALNHAVYYSLIQYDAVKGEYPRIPCWWIFDEKRMTTPLTMTALGATAAGYYEWSENNSKELEAGWILKADTIEELAEKTELDVEALKQTLTEYEASCDSGVDEFGRAADTLIKLEPPFYASMLWPGGPNTSGGPKRSAKAEVIDVRGEAIPRLYSAGELGQVVGDLYPASGGDVCEAISFGAIAARSLAELEPWE